MNKDEMREIAKGIVHKLVDDQLKILGEALSPMDLENWIVEALQKVADEAYKNGWRDYEIQSKQRERTNQACKEKYVELPHEAYDRGFKNGFEACKRMAVEAIANTKSGIEAKSAIEALKVDK